MSVKRINVLIFGLILAVEVFALANRGGGPLLSHAWLTGITFLIVCATAFLVFKHRAQISFKLPQIFYVGFLLFFFISFYFSWVPEFGLNEILLFSCAGILLILIGSFDFKQKEIEAFSVALIALAVADTIFGFFIYTRTAFPRLAGTFIDLNQPYVSTGNDFANFMLLVLPLAFWQIFKKRERITTVILSVLFTGILISGLLLSFSRAAWFSFIGVIVVFVIWLALRRKQLLQGCDFANLKQILVRVAAAIIISALIIGAVQAARQNAGFETTSLTKKLLFQADEGAASVSERGEYWQAAPKILFNRCNPFLGCGVFSFKYLFPEYQQTFGVNIEHPHNIFLKIALENGLIAVLFFLLFLIAAAWKILRFLWKNPLHPALFLAFAGLGALAQNLLDFNFVVANFVVFIILIAVALGFSREEEDKKLSLNSLAEKFGFLKTHKSQFVKIVAIFIFSAALLGLAAYESYYNVDFKRGRAALDQGQIDVAIEKLERAQGMIFQRDLVHSLARAYSEKYTATKDKSWREKEKELLISQNMDWVAGSPDAALRSRFIEISEDEKVKISEELLYSPIGWDPENNLEYYFQYWDYKIRVEHKKIPQDSRQKLVDLLAEYKKILEGNEHFTIMTENPKYASKLYELLGMKKDADEIDRLWFDELIKFTSKYGALTTQKSE